MSINCLRCHNPLFKESFKNNFDLHCLKCDLYYCEHWDTLGFYSFRSTMRDGRALRNRRDVHIERRKVEEI